MLEKIIDTVKKAGEIVLSAHNQESAVTAKEGKKNFVTKYDVAVQEFLFEELGKAFPEAEFVGEEGENNFESNALRFIIDPIDGTTNFMQDYRCSCISVALCKENDLIAGVVYNPYTNEIFSAEKGKGAFENGKRIHVSDCDNIEHAVCATGFACLRAGLEHNNLPYFNKLAPIIRSVLRTGSAAYDLCLVASGRLDAFWEFALQEYDIAAGTIIAREAGAVVTDHRDKNNFPADGILCTTPGLHEQFLAYLN